ncbi:MAG: hypothetical protein LBL79_15410, partial [Prevotella sp.]|nr:hypothetical protein [Prevotella sp.]
VVFKTKLITDVTQGLFYHGGITVFFYSCGALALRRMLYVRGTRQGKRRKTGCLSEHRRCEFSPFSL